MPVAEGKLWKLSYPELAELCQELAHLTSPQVRSDLRDQARLLSRAWSEALAINTHHPPSHPSPLTLSPKTVKDVWRQLVKDVMELNGFSRANKAN